MSQSAPRCVRLLCFLVLLLLAPAGEATAGEGYSLGTAFTYQGRLQHDGQPTEGLHDLSFELFDAEGRSWGVVDRFDVPVSGGGFAVELDFGQPVFAAETYWLEIAVRPAAQGAYTTLQPRQRLTGEGPGCTVDGDVLIDGTLNVDPIGAHTAISVPCCNEADLDGGGQIALGSFFGTLRIDNDEIQSTSLFQPFHFQINPHGGNIGLGVAVPQAPVHLPAGPDVTPSGGGALVIGGSARLAMDSNEIAAQVNGAPATLFLNNDGGEVRIGGAGNALLDIGLQVAEANNQAGDQVDVHCPSGLFIISAGCNAGIDDIEASFPLDSNSWRCRGGGEGISAWAICGRIKW
jgi:hypothetical protein